MIRNAIRKLKPYIPGEQPIGKVIKLNTNENPYPLPHEFYERLKNIISPTLSLYPDPLFLKVREKLAKLWNVKKENIICGNGSDEILRLIIDLVIEPGNKIGLFEPTYSLYEVLGKIREGKIEKFPLDKYGNPDEKPLLFNGKLFFIVTPNAPYGNLIDKNWIIKFLKTFKGLVVIDEAYADFSDEESWINEINNYKNLIVCRTYSKSYSLAGIRFGYAIANENLINELYKIKDSYNLNTFTQYAALYALDYIDEIKENVEKIKKTRNWLLKEFKKLNFSTIPSHSNFIFVRHKRAREIFLKLKSKNIFVRYFDTPILKDGIRITIGTQEQCEILIKTIKDILNEF